MPQTIEKEGGIEVTPTNGRMLSCRIHLHPTISFEALQWCVSKFSDLARTRITDFEHVLKVTRSSTQAVLGATNTIKLAWDGVGAGDQNVCLKNRIRGGRATIADKPTPTFLRAYSTVLSLSIYSEP